MDEQTYVMDEKCQAFESLVIYCSVCSTLVPQFAPYLAQTLEVTLPCLRFYFHEGVGHVLCESLFSLIIRNLMSGYIG